MRKPKYGLWTSSSFSPLHSGQATAIIQDSPGKQLIVAFQSPPFGASHCNLICFCCTAICVSPFSPLHSGQATAITSLIVSALPVFPLSVPSIRGKPLQYSFVPLLSWVIVLSVPSIRGKPLQLGTLSDEESVIRTFSPLHSGQATAMSKCFSLSQPSCVFQSPPFGASHCNRASVEDKKPVFRRFGERGRLLWLSARRF